MPLDVARVRGLFPTLSGGYLHLQGADGALVPETVARAVSAALRVPLSDRGGAFPSSARADALVDAARRAVADLVGGHPSRVVLGPNTTTLTRALSRALSRRWQMGDEIVVSRLDRTANVRPWLTAARAAGVAVRWAEVDIETCELPAWQFDHLLSERTVLVAVTAASGAVGTRPDIAAVAERAHQVGALVYVDGAHATPHAPIDVDDLGADLYVTSTAKWGGPHLAAVVATAEVLEWLGVGRPSSTRLHSDPIDVDRLERDTLELGGLPLELLAGLVASVEHLAGLDESATGGRRDRVLASMSAVQRYEAAVHSHLVGGLRSMRGVAVIGAPVHPAPSLSFTVYGHTPRAVAEELAHRGICAWNGSAGAPGLMDALGVAELGGAIQVGLMHYNTFQEVDRFLDAVADLR